MDDRQFKALNGDGLVIGGSAHGKQYDPDRIGAVLRAPKHRPLATAFADDVSTTDVVTMSVESYNLHPFRNGDAVVRIYMPDHVKPDQALMYLVQMALMAPSKKS